MFGIPLTNKQFNRELRLRQGRKLLDTNLQWDPEYKNEVKKRLVELGYLSFDNKFRRLKEKPQ